MDNESISQRSTAIELSWISSWTTRRILILQTPLLTNEPLGTPSSYLSNFDHLPSNQSTVFSFLLGNGCPVFYSVSNFYVNIKSLPTIRPDMEKKKFNWPGTKQFLAPQMIKPTKNKHIEFFLVPHTPIRPNFFFCADDVLNLEMKWSGITGINDGPR